MNQYLEKIQKLLQQNNGLTGEDKEALLKTIADADKQWGITEFKLDRMEKVKKTTAILLEETIEELERKRKAVEAQNRELEIEAALERVRARTMAMQKSNELPEAANLLFQQVQSLGMPAWSAGYCIWDDDKQAITLWMSSEGVLQPPFKAPTTEDPSFIHMREAYERGETFFVEEIGGEELVMHYKYMRTLPVVGQILDSIIEAGHPLPAFQIFHLAYFSKGFLLFITYQPVPGAHDIFKRFAKVFDQTYTRFLDLQKAEAQARESQIQLALERVRARTMAMQKSEELNEVAGLLFKQVSELGIKTWTTGFNVWSDDNNSWVDYVTNPQGGFIEPYTLDATQFPVFVEVSDAKKRGDEFLVQYVEGEMLKELYSHLMKFGDRKQFEKLLAEGFEFPSRQFHHIVFGSKVSLMFITYEPAPEAHEIFKRFGKVFEQTYTRFLDLQKAEAQAREAQIQLALERVRARTMAMHNSSELSEAASLLFDQLRQLGAVVWSCGFAICEKDKDVVEKWMTSPDTGKVMDPLHFSITDPDEHRMYDAWKNGVELYTYVSEGDELRKSYEEMMAIPYFNQRLTRFLKEGIEFPVWQQNYIIPFRNGYLLIMTRQPFEETQIFVRFAKVFEQTYTRFLDLQRAEAQAREAQIEAALERVRAKAMAMHKTGDLDPAVAVVFEELEKLDLGVLRCGISVLDKEKRTGDVWVTSVNKEGSAVQVSGDEAFDIHPLLQGAFDAWLRQEDFYYVLKGDDLTAYYNAVKSARFQLPESQFISSENGERQQHCFVAVYHGGGLFAFLDTEFSDEAKKVMKRFAAVFDLTYKRFVDLQKAEAQAREAEIELGLERIRARAMAMQNSEELKDVVKELRKQIALLGQKELHTCVIQLYDESPDEIYAWASIIPSGKDEEIREFYGRVPKKGLLIQEEALQAYLSGREDYTLLNEGKKLEQWMYFMKETYPEIYAVFLETMNGLKPEEVPAYWSFSAFGGGSLLMVTYDPPGEVSKELLRRFSNVFGLAYRRFADLKQAEAQAREAEIELALERVRAKTMAMQHQNDLLDVTDLLAEQLIHLGFDLEIVNFSNGLSYGDWDLWVTSPTSETARSIDRVVVPWIDHPYFQKTRIGLDNFKKGIDLNVAVFSKEEKDSFLDHIFSNSVLKNLPNESRAYLYNKPGFTSSAIFLKETWLAICKYDTKPFTDEQHAILKRFANAFGQAYTRFLDLQKAEAQAREAQIEAALERVRSHSLAMHRSDELQEVVHTVFERLRDLNVDFYTVIIVIFKEDSRDIFWWLENKEQQQYPRILLPYSDNPYLRGLFEARESGAELFSKYYSFEEKNELFHYLFSDTDFKNVPEEQKKFLLETEFATMSVALAKNTGIHITSYSRKSFSDQDNEILKRFANVFDQAYTRFLDLQKAEALAREAQIEAALERVRSRTTGMQKSEELREVIQMVFEQLRQLDFNIDSAHFNLNYKESDDYNLWSAAPGQPYPVKTYIPYFDHPVFRKARDAKEKGLDFFTENYTQEEKNKFFERLFKETPVIPEERKKYILSGKGVAASTVLMNTISLWIMNYAGIPYSQAENAILKRFGKIFEQSHTRFLDLQKAEAQAKEATIEAALERVRAKAMAMHNSNDLSVTASMVFTELRKLGINPVRCGVGLLTKESLKAQLYSATSLPDGDNLALIGWVLLSGHPALENIYQAWMKNEDYFPELSGEQLKSYYEKLLTGLSLPTIPDWKTEQKQFGHFIPFSIGCLYAWSDRHYNDAEIKILKRFAAIIDLTFRRFMELQKSEANAREAVKQAALDRIRADIASMRTVSDLDRITPLIWNELTILGVPFIRCGVFIMDDSQELIHTFLSTPDGKSIAAFHLPYDTPGNFSQVLNHWRDKKNYIDHWIEADFITLVDILVKQRAIETKEQYLKTIPHSGFYLHFLPFLQGMLYVGNTTKLGEEEIRLIQSVADAFSTAYARYEDFNKLEAAKKQVDKTLVDLRQAQQQLIQSEKMASLGELTAGIAHEIQNPLNFVNNFSEVNEELISELVDEVDKGNYDEVKAIANDIKENEEKILHHGKRADAIVKGMLQHSRASAGKKEPTDINALADEYLRLSYHGMRAKDKSFNAIVHTDFDESIGKINVVPQDTGRVLLNLFNNAFYATNQKQKSESLKSDGTQYIPAVTVVTRKTGVSVEIIVRDNGNGVPQNIVDKIFQPFFTTKPTGQGTGLGLSLAYDIIKAHGGEIKVASKEGRGAEFVIRFPLN